MFSVNMEGDYVIDENGGLHWEFIPIKCKKTLADDKLSVIIDPDSSLVVGGRYFIHKNIGRYLYGTGPDSIQYSYDDYWSDDVSVVDQIILDIGIDIPLSHIPPDLKRYITPVQRLIYYGDTFNLRLPINYYDGRRNYYLERYDLIKGMPMDVRTSSDGKYLDLTLIFDSNNAFAYAHNNPLFKPQPLGIPIRGVYKIKS
jgi:hypothetical protein